MLRCCDWLHRHRRQRLRPWAASRCGRLAVAAQLTAAAAVACTPLALLADGVAAPLASFLARYGFRVSITAGACRRRIVVVAWAIRHRCRVV
jgi:hypothetical protein